MSNVEFDCKELDNYVEHMYYELCEDYPKIARRFMEKTVNTCAKEAARRTPRAAKKSKKYRRSRHLQDCWKGKTFNKPGKTFGVVKNTAPHAHLIEHGHVTQNGGWVEGRHMLENTMTAQQPKVDKQIEKLVDHVFNKASKG